MKNQEYQIDNKQEMYDSLVQSFEFEVGKGQRKKIAAKAKEMIKQLGKKKDPITKEYIMVLNRIVKDFEKKQTPDEIAKEIQAARYKK